VSASLDRALRAIVGDAGMADVGDARFRRDATESQALEGRPDAVVLPAGTDEVAAVVRWCYAAPARGSSRPRPGDG
jgi:FAD/FMN-containing dehydrogenase